MLRAFEVLSGFLLLVLPGLCTALLDHPNNIAPRSGYIIHEKRAPHPAWHLPDPTRRLPRTAPLPGGSLRIALKQPAEALNRLPALLLAVSDPDSPAYGKHWTPAQVARAFTPPEEAVERVRGWLEGEGVQRERIKIRRSGAWMEVRAVGVGEAERILGAKYRVYKRAGEEGGEEYIACDSYSLPRSISDVVDFVTPTVQPNVGLDDAHREGERAKPGAMRLAKRAAAEAGGVTTGCDKVVTPDCIRALYNMSYVPQATDRNSLGIVSYYANTYLQSDLDTFFRNFSPTLVGKSPELISIDGRTTEQDDNTDVGETGYILQYAMSLVQSQPVQLLQLGNQQTGEFRSFNEWLDAVDGSYCTSNGGDDFTYDPVLPDPLPGGLKDHTCGTVKAPYVVSSSQAVFEYAFSQFYLERQCNEFAKLGLMGVTVLYSAGNAGTSGATNGYCLDKNGSMNANATLFNPSWPASCPWVTAVGGTQVKAGAAAAPGAEEVWNEEIIPGFFESGGGGFSNRFSTPAYQKQAVNAYVNGLTKSDPGHLRLFNAKGRAYPDLSAVANQFLNVDNGSVITSSGTSGAVPTVASIITLVNDARLAAGKKPVGFINPTIYSSGFASAFNDVTSGTNQGCRGLQGERGGGFKAGKGWDPASGLGSPNLGLLIEKWLALP